VGYIDVYLNGVRLSGADFTATNGTSVVISTAANAGDTIDVVQYTMGIGATGPSPSATMTQWRKAAVGGETTLSGTDDFSVSLSYTINSELVFINGVLLERGVDYAATNGTTITGLTALVAGDIATVVSVAAFTIANAVALSTVTAKGDLIAATGASTVSNVAVGADGSTLVANSAAASGVSWTSGSVIPNPFLNSGMDVWQRNTSFSETAGVNYTADRWAVNVSVVTTTTVSRVASGLTGFNYALRWQRNSGTTSTPLMVLGQSIETANSLMFAGKQVTLSFYARVGANYSASSLNYVLATGTGTDESVMNGYTGTSYPISNNATLTTSWQRVTATATLSSSATEIGLQFNYYTAGTAGANDYFDITGVQLDLGPVALPVRRNGSTYEAELAACQRYYQTASNFQYLWYGYATSGTTYYQNAYLVASMRVAPSVTVSVYGAAGFNAGTLAVAATTTNAIQISCVATATGIGYFEGSYYASAEL
jgi:hypothetical protein